MSHYGGTITTGGRNLITSLLKGGEVLQFTRVLVGSGVLEDSINPIDVTGLVTPVCPATSTIPKVEDGIMQFVVEYRNDMNGGLQQGFWLREFGIYAKTTTMPECLFYYATLGDSPQPVNKYMDGRIDVRRYPISIALELDSSKVQITYNPGSFITAGEAKDYLDALVEQEITEAAKKIGGVMLAAITIPRGSWEQIDPASENATDKTALESGYQYTSSIDTSDAKSDRVPVVALHSACLNAASVAGLCPTMEAIDGAVRLFSIEPPSIDLTGSLSLLSNTIIYSETTGKSSYVLPVASATTLGGAKVTSGSGLKMNGEYLQVDFGTEGDLEG